MIREPEIRIDTDEYVPWPYEGCDLASAAGRVAAGIWSNIEPAKESCPQFLLRGDLIAYGQSPRVEGDVSRPINPGTWSSLKIDWRSGNAFGPNGTEISNIRIFTPIIAPCRVEILDQMPIAEAFRRFVLHDPEVEALAAVALAVAPNWKPFFHKGESIHAERGDWPVDLNRWWFAKPVHPTPAKQSKYERRDRPDPLELVVAVAALKHRYRCLMALLQTGAMAARGVPARAGFSENIMRSVWSHEDFYLRVATGDVLQDNDQSADQFDRTLRSWIGVVLYKPATPTADANREERRTDFSEPVFHVNNTGSDPSPPNEKATRRIETAARSYRECVTWLVGIMRASPEIRTATVDEHWDEAKGKWPGTLSRRSFEDARREAIKRAKAQAWTAAGRSKKSPRTNSPR